MRILEFLREGDVVGFPTHMAKRDSLMSKLAKASSNYKEPGVRIFSFLITNDDGSVYEKFETQEEAEKALPKLKMLTGKRDLYVTEL